MQHLQKPRLQHVRDDIGQRSSYCRPKIKNGSARSNKIVKEIGSLKRHFRSVLSTWIEAARVPPSYETTKGAPGPCKAMQARFNQLEAEMDALKGQPDYDPADMAVAGAFVSARLRGWRTGGARVHPQGG